MVEVGVFPLGMSACDYLYVDQSLIVLTPAQSLRSSIGGSEGLSNAGVHFAANCGYLGTAGRSACFAIGQDRFVIPPRYTGLVANDNLRAGAVQTLACIGRLGIYKLSNPLPFTTAP
jgi:hypothetical protein